MSYELVERIKLENGEVHIKSASNNVIPKSYRYWKSDHFTKLLKESPELFEKEVMRMFYHGEFQAKGNSAIHLDQAIAVKVIVHRLGKTSRELWESMTDDEIMDQALEVLKKIRSFDKNRRFTFVMDRSKNGLIMKDDPLYLCKITNTGGLKFYDTGFHGFTKWDKPITFNNPYKALFRIGFHGGLFTDRSFNMIELDHKEFKNEKLSYDPVNSIYMIDELKDLVVPYPTKEEMIESLGIKN